MAVLWIGFDEFVVPFKDSSISSQSRFSQLGTDGFRFTDQSAVLFVKVFQIVRSLNQRRRCRKTASARIHISSRLATTYLTRHTRRHAISWK